MAAIASVDELYQGCEFKRLSLGVLNVDMVYQRAPALQKVKRIAANYDEAAAGVLIVNRRADGSYFIMDGNHRYLGMKDAGAATAPCLVTCGLTQYEEARVFILCQTERKAPKAQEVFKARLATGDHTAIAIKTIVEQCGFFLELGRTSSDTPRGISAIEALNRVHSLKESDILRRTLTVISRIWTNDHAVKHGDVIKGVATFLRLYPEVQVEELVAKLQPVPVSAIFQLASSYRMARGKKGQPARFISMALLEKYNHKRRNRLPDRHVGRVEDEFRKGTID